jgi:hypothetical protein
MGQKAKFRGDQRMSALASEADISRFTSTRPSDYLARMLRSRQSRSPSFRGLLQCDQRQWASIILLLLLHVPRSVH